MKITYNGPLQAPIAKGAQIARLEVKMGQDAPIVLPLVAGADVPPGAGSSGSCRVSAGSSHERRAFHRAGGRGRGRQVDPVAASCDGFARAGHEVVQTREPGGTQGAEAIRALLLGVEGEGGAQGPRLCCSPPRAPIMSKG
jgi:hypothetical protein